MDNRINIEGFLHKVRMYRENVIFKETSNGLISLSERAKLEKNISEMGKAIDRAIPLFKDMACESCAKNKTCFSQRFANYKCFEIEWTLIKE